MRLRTCCLVSVSALVLLACPPKTEPPKSEVAAPPPGPVPPPPQATAKLFPGPGAEPYLKVRAQGTQSYACLQSDGGPAWGPAVPEAMLYDLQDGGLVGRHLIGSAGPTWEWTADHSFFVGSKSIVDGFASAPSPDDAGADLPWLLLPRKTGSDAGVLGPAIFVQRLNTLGGTSADQPLDCNSGGVDAGLLMKLPYAATYLFYRAATPAGR